MATPTDIFVTPVIELIEDASLALKWTNSAVVIRLLSQFATMILWAFTNGVDQKTGEKIIDVAPETAQYYGILALVNLFGLPLDITYISFLNAAKDGNTQAVAQDATV